MKKQTIAVAAALLLLAGGSQAAALTVNFGTAIETTATTQATTNARGKLTVNGTGNTATMNIKVANLPQDLKLTASTGFEVTPAVIEAGTNGEVAVTVKLTSYLAKTTGTLVMRAGDLRSYVDLTGIGTPLPEKALSEKPVSTESKSFTTGAEFAPEAGKGYTIEFRAKTAGLLSTLKLYAVDAAGMGAKTLIERQNVALYNGDNTNSLTNPATNVEGGKGVFYNTDGAFHTYRLAFTPDSRVFVYRDGLPVDTLRAHDFGHTTEMLGENGVASENLVKNGTFEGEFGDFHSGLIHSLEGWQFSSFDQYNCKFDVVKREINNEYDKDNHVVQLTRYNWNDGWGDGEVTQIIDVVPGETYNLSFLAKGGDCKPSGKDNYDKMGWVRLCEVNNPDKGIKVIVDSDDFKEYAGTYTASEDCNQLRLMLVEGRFLNGGGWGSSVHPLEIDNIKLQGMSRLTKAEAGYKAAGGAAVEYFTYDLTGAYAPVPSRIEASEDFVEINGTNNMVTLNVSSVGLNPDNKIQITVPAGFTAFPATLAPNAEGQFSVILDSYLEEVEGTIVLRSGDVRTYIPVAGYGTALPQKNLDAANVVTEETAKKFSDDKFAAGTDGYTVEFSVRPKNIEAEFTAYAVDAKGNGFKTYVRAKEMGLFHSDSKVGLKNPANSGEGGTGTFYNNDRVHTYRFAVTPDKHMFIYRDGMMVDVLRTKDYAHAAEWLGNEGPLRENLITNPGFEEEVTNNADSLLIYAAGWMADPIDRYNCNYNVVNREINNELDADNHVMQLTRYNWNDGWGDGTISQIVDVVPGTEYSLSFLAKGGDCKPSGKDFVNMGSVRIEEVQNSANKTSVTIDSEDFKEYSLTYTTSDECNQLRVVLNQSRFLNGGGWGSTVNPMEVDEVKLTGTSRKVNAQTGYTGKACELTAYKYDTTGAYAPLVANIDGAEDALAAADITVTAANGELTVNGLQAPAYITVTDLAGRVVYAGVNAGEPVAIPATGVLVCKVDADGETSAHKVIL